MPRGIPNPNSPSKPKRHKLLDALYDTLPAPGEEFPVGKREAFLSLMKGAFDVAYGPVERPMTMSETREAFRHPLETVIHGPDGAPPAAFERAVEEQKRPTRPSNGIPPTFRIDKDGFAMRDGFQIDPHEIPSGAILWDERTDYTKGDVSGIFWKTGGVTKQPPPADVQLRPGKPPRAQATNGEAIT